MKENSFLAPDVNLQELGTSLFLWEISGVFFFLQLISFRTFFFRISCLQVNDYPNKKAYWSLSWELCLSIFILVYDICFFNLAFLQFDFFFNSAFLAWLRYMEREMCILLVVCELLHIVAIAFFFDKQSWRLECSIYNSGSKRLIFLLVSDCSCQDKKL